MLIKTITHKKVCLHKGVIWRINAIITHWTTWIDTQTFLWGVGVGVSLVTFEKLSVWNICFHGSTLFVVMLLFVILWSKRNHRSEQAAENTHSHLDTEDCYSWKNNHLMDISHTFKVEMSSVTSASLCWTLLFAYLLCVSAGETERVLNATGFFWFMK